MIRNRVLGKTTQLDQLILNLQLSKGNIRCLSSKRRCKSSDQELMTELTSLSTSPKTLLNVTRLTASSPASLLFVRDFHSRKHRSSSPPVKSWQPSFFPKSKEVQQKEEQEQLLEHTRGILKSERSRAKNAFQHGVIMGSNIRGQSGSDSNDSFLFRMVSGGNTAVYIFRRLIGLGAACVLLYFSYNVYNMQDSQKNAIIGSANSTLDPSKSSGVRAGSKMSRFKAVNGTDFKPVRFADIVGCDEAKDELQDIVFYLRKPRQLAALGGKVPKGVLLMGPPGVGKTMMARAVATEAGVPFFYQSGSSFDEIFVGVGASRVKELFEKARKHAPCVIFIDEIDAVGGDRSSRGNSRQTINQLLAEMDGFKENNGIIVIGATNLGQILDPALTRAGRFDNKVVLSLPDADGRIKLVQHYLKKVKTDGTLDVTKFATNLIGYSGAAIENLVNQAALKAANDGDVSVQMKHLDWARVKNELGREKNKKGDFVEDLEELKNTAYHEAAHTIVAHYLKVPYYGVTIERRSNSLGHLRYDISEDFLTKQMIQSRIAVALAGKLGEEALLGASKDKHTTGCSSDYQHARAFATKFVTTYGFGERLYPAGDEWIMSEKYQAMIEKEVKGILDNAEETAKKIMEKHAKEHLKLSEKLLEKYKLTADEIKQILK